MIPHGARALPFRDLVAGLQAARDQRLVAERPGKDGLRLYCYTQSCVYDRGWDPITLLARGLILDMERETVVATPFPKFFNVGERDETVPDLPFETFEKLDGSLIILFHHGGEWRTATKGSLGSDQALSAAAWLVGRDVSALTPGTTYLAEWVAPDNRIVVHYPEPKLVLLAAYDEGGHELDYRALVELSARLGWRLAARHGFMAVSDLLVHAKMLPPSEEGFVLRFSSGLRLKVKGDEYRRIHALISDVTPLGIWRAMEAGSDIVSLRRQLPEEFWGDFDQITTALDARVSEIVGAVAKEASALAHLADKEIGLRLSEFPEPVRTFIFPFRKSGGDLLAGRTRGALFRSIRPTGNQLSGYTPSFAMNRVMDEAL